MYDNHSAAIENVSLYLILSMNCTFSTRNHVAALFGNDCLGCFDFYYNSGLSCLMTAIQDFFHIQPSLSDFHFTEITASLVLGFLHSIICICGLDASQSTLLQTSPKAMYDWSSPNIHLT